MNSKPVLKEKGYAHFDKRVRADTFEAYVKSPESVAHHAFMPLIHFTKEDVRYSKTNGREKKKPRDLFYVSHKDAFMYQWYSNSLNSHYNKRVVKDGTNNCVVAYRNNKPGKFNAHFAKEAIDFIRKVESCYIIVGDFTGFFDNLEHAHLKKMLCDLLEVERLRDDYWAVLKSVMQYSWFEFDDLTKLNDLKKFQEINKLPTVLPIAVFRENKSTCLKKNRHRYGIPQGTPISAFLSNLYMLCFDKQMNNLLSSAKGLYRRYSDDFIIVIPSTIDLNEIWQKIDSIIKSTPRIVLQEKKTKVFSYEDLKILNCNSCLFPTIANSKNELEYLGFAFDGERISIREKTISKYYYRAYRRVDSARLRKYGIIDKRADYYTLYKNYTHLGKSAKGKNRGNFLTYVDRCKKVFGENEKVDIVSKKHWDKIQNRLNTPIVASDISTLKQ